MPIHKLSVGNGPTSSQRHDWFSPYPTYGSPLANEKSHLDVIRNSDPVITPSRLVRSFARSLLFLRTRAVTFFSIRNLNQNAARRVLPRLQGKNKMGTGRPDERPDIVPLSRSSGHEPFPFGGSRQLPSARSKSARASSSRHRMTGWRDPGRAEAEKERQEERSGEQKRKGEKRREPEKEEEIVHLSSCKVGKMDGTRNFPSLRLRCAPLGRNLQFLTIRLDQPPTKGRIMLRPYGEILTGVRMRDNPSSSADKPALKS